MEYGVFSIVFLEAYSKNKVVHGATATGLANPNSKTQALGIFENYLKEEVKKDDYVVFQLGEVDCGFAIWYRAEKHGLSIQKQTQLAIDNYSSLIQKSSAINGKKTIICSAVLPTIQEGSNFGEVANLRKEVKANVKERTQLTLDFNRMLRQLAEKNRLAFIDLDQSLLNEKTSIIHSKFLHKDSTNHHLDPSSLAKIIIKGVKYYNLKTTSKLNCCGVRCVRHLLKFSLNVLPSERHILFILITTNIRLAIF